MPLLVVRRAIAPLDTMMPLRGISLQELRSLVAPRSMYTASQDGSPLPMGINTMRGTKIDSRGTTMHTGMQRWMVGGDMQFVLLPKMPSLQSIKTAMISLPQWMRGSGACTLRIPDHDVMVLPGRGIMTEAPAKSNLRRVIFVKCIPRRLPSAWMRTGSPRTLHTRNTWKMPEGNRSSEW